MSRYHKGVSDLDRFNEFTYKTDHCWFWIGFTDRKGRGSIRKSGGRRVGSSRFSYEHHKGKIPRGLCVCHTCDNPSCVNPDHLFLGTIAENNKDCEAKNRRWTGSKLDYKDVKKIRSLYMNTRKTQLEISKKFGVSRPLVSLIVNNRLWNKEWMGV